MNDFVVAEVVLVKVVVAHYVVDRDGKPRKRHQVQFEEQPLLASENETDSGFWGEQVERLVSQLEGQALEKIREAASAVE